MFYSLRASVGVYGVALSLFLSSCLPVISSPDSSPSVPMQVLPITAQFTVGDRRIELEVAKTPEQQATGLMSRPSLAPNRGMMFEFSPARVARFWMKNTLIDLDIIFLRQGKILSMEKAVSPCPKDPCPVYGPFLEVDQVVELAAGQAEQLGLKIGDRLRIEPLTTP